jgi:hypothetical protein
MEPDMARTRASIKKAHQLLAPTAALADMLAVPRLQHLLDNVAAGQVAKQRAQRKNQKAQAARPVPAEVGL